MEELSRVISNSWQFYRERMRLIVFFSIPFLFAFAMLALVHAPTYQALGGLFSRTGSIPELSTLDIIIIAVAYAVSFFIIADAITNVNLIIRSKRTLTPNTREVVAAMSHYATRIFYIYTIMLLLIFLVQILLYDSPLKAWIFPLFVLAVSFLLFFVAPAVVIDEEGTPGAISKSINMALRRPGFVAAWTLIGFVSLSIVKLLSDLVFPHSFSPYVVFFINSLFVLPYLIVLQTQMYMEKYPLAR
jgi:hypothetical protein